MVVQSLISIAILGLVIARAVNILLKRKIPQVRR